MLSKRQVSKKEEAPDTIPRPPLLRRFTAIFNRRYESLLAFENRL
jgi:hypothetical protein